jgi:hypothetical protein
MLHKRGPKVETCGTPKNIGKGEGNFPKMRTEGNVNDKELRVK